MRVPGERVAALRTALEPHVRANVLGTALVHLTMPGVPDLYQGTENEYRALVDPDNRRPVSFPPPAEGEKAAVTRAALALRARRPDAFGRRRRTSRCPPRAGGGPLHRVRALRCRPHGRDPAVAAAGAGGRLAGHDADAAARPVADVLAPGGSSPGTHAWRSCSRSFRWRCWSGWTPRERRLTPRATAG